MCYKPEDSSADMWIEVAVIIATTAKTLWDLYKRCNNDD